MVLQDVLNFIYSVFYLIDIICCNCWLNVLLSITRGIIRYQKTLHHYMLQHCGLYN